MPSLNKIEIIGTLGKDPEFKPKPNGKAVCKLLLVTDESYTNGVGDYIEEVEWHVVKLYNQRAEYAYQYLRKGNLVYTEGSKRTIRWQDENNNTRYFTEIRSLIIKKLDNKGIDTPRELPEYTTEPPATPAQQNSPTQETEPDPLYNEAVAIITAQATATTDGLQKILKVPYARAAQLLDIMATNGIVSKETNGTRTVIK